MDLVDAVVHEEMGDVEAGQVITRAPRIPNLPNHPPLPDVGEGRGLFENPKIMPSDA